MTPSFFDELKDAFFRTRSRSPMTEHEVLQVIRQTARRGDTALRLNAARIRELPPEVEQLTSLKTFILCDNELTRLPPEIGNLTNLTMLDLRGNRLSMLPPEIGRLTRLETLLLSNNRLMVLPPEIGQLTNVRKLVLRGNDLKFLPREISWLTSLEHISLAQNQLTSLPPGISNLSRLRTLNLGDSATEGNPLTTLPPELGRLERLEELKIEGNPLQSPPPEIVTQGTAAVLTYLRERLESERPVWESKLLVVGEGGVGKTQLLRALNGEDFQVDSETTHGIGVIPLPLEHPSEPGVTMTLNAWDFGGQEVYHATYQFFLALRSLYLLVWNSRLGWEQGKLHYWLDTIHALAPDSPVMLVGTHIDARAADLPFDDLQKKYPQLVGEWSVSNSDDYRELGDGIDGLREALQATAADLPLMGITWPVSFWNTKQSIVKLRKTNTWIPSTKLWEIMAENNVSEAARPVLARQLHELGELIHFPDDEALKDIVLLDAEFVTKRISDVLEYDGIQDGLGIFTREHMRECWPDLDHQLQDRFLQLMERFDLSYEIPDDPEDRSLLVERLAYDPAPYGEKWDELSIEHGYREIRMKFDPQSTRPAGIPTWFIARSHRFTTHTHWRFGALFSDTPHNRHLALVDAPAGERHITLSVRGPNPQSFFSVLRDGLELTFARFPGLVLKRTMPCPEKLDDGRECPYEFDLAHLEKRIQRTPPIETIECPECLNQVPVLRLLYGLNWTMKDRVLQRLDELEEIVDGQAQKVLEELGDLRELTQRQFLTLFDAEQRLGESHCPRVFSLRPLGRNSWPGVDKLLNTKWQVQLYCEAPGCWHPSVMGKKKGLYTISEPAKWVNTIAPWAKRLITVFKYAAHFANPVLGFTAAGLSELLKNDIGLMKALIDKLPDVTTGRDVKDEYGLEEADKSRAGGASLRSLRHLLTELDPKQEWGGLRKLLTPEGHWLWLCDEHRDAYLQ